VEILCHDTKTLMPPELITTRTAIYSIREDGIIVQVVLSGSRQSLCDAEENVRAYRKLANGRKCLLLVDMREPFSMDEGVRQYYASDVAGQFCLALAMLVSSQSSRILGNLFLTLSRPVFPCRMFTTMPEAISWLVQPKERPFKVVFP